MLCILLEQVTKQRLISMYGDLMAKQPFPVASLLSEIRGHAQPEFQEAMQAYMKHHFVFLGIKQPLRKSLLKEFFAAHGKPEVSEFESIVSVVWEQPEREFQYIGLDIASVFVSKLDSRHLAFIQHLITEKSWWDTVDVLASKIAGTILRKESPDFRQSFARKLSHTDHMWLQRTAILFQLGYKNETDIPLLFEIIAQHAASSEFFIQKAIGWALRELAKTQPEIVKQFVANTPLKPLSKREALKHFR